MRTAFKICENYATGDKTIAPTVKYYLHTSPRI